MDSATQEILALEEAASALCRMIERGVSLKHIPGTALFMVGELYCRHDVIAIWLDELARKYRYSVN